jgi:SAM-dependent methyltransferase
MDFIQAAHLQQRYRAATLSRVLAEDDVMYRSGKESYYYVGESALNCILSALTLSRLSRVGSVLNLPCGHGREARHLAAAFPDAEHVFCDISASGVAFCAAQFHGRGIVSKAELTEVELGGPYDVIWIGSLFTHLDQDKTERWLRYLCGHLSEDGILLASFHGAASRQLHLTHFPMATAEQWALIDAGYQGSGYGYAPWAGQDYGISLTRPATIVALAGTIPGTRLLCYSERAWSENHDVAVIARSDRLQDWREATGQYFTPPTPP